ncbi:MAG: hypothetical protein WCG62_04040 [Actinomycetes bacterium]
MNTRQSKAIRDRRIDRSRRIAQSLFVFAAASGGVGVGLMSHAAATPSTTSTPLTTTTLPGHPTTTTTPGHHTTTTGVHTTTTVWTPPVTVPVTHPTTCHTSASGQFLGCW